MEDPKETTFFELPQELIWKMLYYLPPRDTLHFCETYSGAAIICKDNYFWLEKIWRDFGDVYEIQREDIPVENRLGTYKAYWKDAKAKLISCAGQGKVECVESLLQLGVNPNVQSGVGNTALIMASTRGHVDMVRMLLDHKASPDIQSKMGGTALMHASHAGRMGIVRVLLDHHANPDLQDSFERTALMDASGKGFAAIVRLLLEHDANPDLQDRFGRTALKPGAYYRRYQDVVRVLLEHGADPDL